MAIQCRIQRILYGLTFLSLCFTSLSLWSIASKSSAHVKEFEGRTEEVRRVDPEVFQQRQAQQSVVQLKRKHRRESQRGDPEVMEHRQSVEQLKKDFENDHRRKNVKLMRKAFDLLAVNREQEEVGGTTPSGSSTTPPRSTTMPTQSQTTYAAESDTPTAEKTGSDTPSAESTGSDTPIAHTAGNDSPSSKVTGSDTPSVSHNLSSQDTPSPVTHFPSRKFPMVPPTSEAQKLEALHGITLEDCSVMDKLPNRRCHSYEDMRFLSSDESSRTVALASFPGSGNTWVRLLIEQATGVFTGSVYNDKSLKCTGFLAEGIKGRERNEFVAVKTHENNGKWDAAIFLIRNPYKAIVSYYNLMLTGSHTMTTKLREIPDQLFMLVYGEWLNLWDFFIFNQTVPFPVHIVQYENLVDNFKVELEPLVSFLNQTLAPEKLDCLIKEKNDHYQRQKHASVNIFTEEQTAQIEDWITDHEEALTRLKINYKNWKWQP